MKLALPTIVMTVLTGLLLVQNIHTPAVAQSGAFSIYFEYQKFDVTPDAQQLVVLIKGDIKKSSRVTLVGHCDTSESDSEKLSLARAMEIQKELVTLGIPPRVAITVVGKGATELQKPTGPGVREPRNRFVSIIIE
jgi:outer membrane protein OmpA-like peptidoglycan-associated protein